MYLRLRRLNLGLRKLLCNLFELGVGGLNLCGLIACPLDAKIIFS